MHHASLPKWQNHSDGVVDSVIGLVGVQAFEENGIKGGRNGVKYYFVFI